MRKTRALPNIHVNHGAPYCDIRTDTGRANMNNDLGPNCVSKYSGVVGCLDSVSGKFIHDNSNNNNLNNKKVDYVTGANGEMLQIASSLLTHNIDTPSTIDAKYKTMIRGL